MPLRRGTFGYCGGMDDLVMLRKSVSRVLVDFPVVFSYLYGSRATGTEREHSDVDIAVYFDAGVEPARRFEYVLRIGVVLERTLASPVDVLDLNGASLRIAGRVLSERVILTGFDSVERVRFETRLLPQYLD